VIIPVYNREKTVCAAIRSVLEQTFGDFEVLVVDDASSDGTVQAVRACGDPRVSLAIHETNRYAGAARNTGMNYAKGELIAFLDSDDCWERTKLERQVALFNGDPNLVFCCTGLRMMKGRGIREKTLLPKISQAQPILRYMTGRTFIVTSTVMFRRSILGVVGMMDPALRRNQDIDFFLRVLDRYPVVGIEEPLVEFFPSADRPCAAVIAESNERLLRNNRRIIEQSGRYAFRRVSAYYQVRHAQRLMAEGRFAAGAKALSEAARTWPFLSPKQYLIAGYRLLLGALFASR
jgi:glycosyltransferase involved in cell wall biosynthesis